MSAETATGVQSDHVIGHRSGRTYALRIVVVLAESVSWRTPVGIQSARVGGKTQAEVPLRTVRTPWEAHAS
jgi:hypothetical protein